MTPVPCLSIPADGPVAVATHPHAAPRSGTLADSVVSGVQARAADGEVLYLAAPGYPLQPVRGAWSDAGFACGATTRAAHRLSTVEVRTDAAWVVGCGAVTAVVDGRAIHGVAAYPCFLQAVDSSGVTGLAVRLAATPAEVVVLGMEVGWAGCRFRGHGLRYDQQRVFVAHSDVLARLTSWSQGGDELLTIDGVEVALIGDVEALLCDLGSPAYPGRFAVHGLREGAVWTDTTIEKNVFFQRYRQSIYDPGNDTY
jgi:hypothetical protein